MKIQIIKKATLFILSFIILYGCDKSNINDDDTIHGSGKIVTQTREVEECSGLMVQNIGMFI